MKKFQMYFLAAACCLFVLQSCTKEDVTITEDNSAVEDVLRKGNAPTASGQGTIDFGAEGKRHFSFNAITKKDGSVKGNGVLTYTGGELKIKFNIDCIRVVGNTAYITGKITSHSGIPENAGRDCLFVAIDNGEGTNADPDILSGFYTSIEGGDLDCNIDYGGISYFEVLEGNIQVSE
ncbi:hypothetical protein MWU50_08400 [Flavobacteriaceae bacterium S0862]|nr:hypothetical protein [Flavobacteriaceae bacterium S0862]